MSPSRQILYLAPSAALVLCIACTTAGQSSETNRVTSGSEEAAQVVSIATLTPEARVALMLETPRAALTPQPTVTLPSATNTPTQTPDATPAPVAASATPVPSSSPTPPATQTPPATPTASATPTPSATPTSSATPTPIVVDGIALSDREQQLFAAHNQIREDLGIAPLRLNATLMGIARDRGETMANTGLFSHYAPNGDTIFDLLDDATYEWSDATENIHYNNVSPGAVSFAMAEYRKSPAHYANIIDPGFRRVGIGFVTAPSGIHYAVVVFTD